MKHALDTTVALVIVCALATWGCGGSPTSPSSTGTAAASTCTPQGTFTISRGDVLKIAFSIAPGDWDVLVTGVGLMEGPNSSQDTASLYNGSQLLGTQHESLMFWKSASSPFADGTVINFDVIRDGTIDGRLEFSIASGTALIDGSRPVVSVGRATGPNSWTGVPGQIKSVTLVSTSCR